MRVYATQNQRRQVMDLHWKFRKQGLVALTLTLNLTMATAEEIRCVFNAAFLALGNAALYNAGVLCAPPVSILQQ
jgi:hypothetical protein